MWHVTWHDPKSYVQVKLRLTPFCPHAQELINKFYRWDVAIIFLNHLIYIFAIGCSWIRWRHLQYAVLSLHCCYFRMQVGTFFSLCFPYLLIEYARSRRWLNKKQSRVLRVCSIIFQMFLSARSLVGTLLKLLFNDLQQFSLM